MTTVRRSALILCMTLWGRVCTSIPGISPYGQQPYEVIFSAPLVIVGVADSDIRVGAKRPSRSVFNDPTQLHRVRVHVENLLRGELAERTLWVYYFGFGSAIDGPRPLGFGKEASRRIFWLRRDSGVLRMACDGFDDCTMFVESGAHLGYRPEPGKPLGYAMADILLTRGDGDVNENRFASSVAWGAPSTIPEDYLLKKYAHLALTEIPSLRAAACSQIWVYTQDRGSAPADRHNAGKAMNETDCHAEENPRGSPRRQ